MSLDAIQKLDQMATRQFFTMYLNTRLVGIRMPTVLLLALLTYVKTPNKLAPFSRMLDSVMGLSFTIRNTIKTKGDQNKRLPWPAVMVLLSLSLMKYLQYKKLVVFPLSKLQSCYPLLIYFFNIDSSTFQTCLKNDFLFRFSFFVLKRSWAPMLNSSEPTSVPHGSHSKNIQDRASHFLYNRANILLDNDSAFYIYFGTSFGIMQLCNTCNYVTFLFATKKNAFIFM